MKTYWICLALFLSACCDPFERGRPDAADTGDAGDAGANITDAGIKLGD